MVQWALICSVAALYAAGASHVDALPLQEDPTTGTDELLTLNAHHPALGAYLSPDDSPTVATTVSVTASGSSSAQVGAEASSDAEYTPGVVQPASDARRRRRLEVTKSTDMLKLETFFGEELVTDLTQLPTKAEHNPIAWPSSYWPVYADSINYRWAGDDVLSPAEKYATSFGHDVTTLTDAVSLINGVDSQSSRTACTVDADCTSLNDGSVCAMRLNQTAGYCIPTWFGVCHAWAPASILEAEPTCAVTRNGTTFQPYDIKALLTLAYDGSSIATIFTGTRFNGDDNAANNTDEYGRFTDASRRDISPGFFHVAITNIMGRFNHSFVVDVTAGNEVWNQPVRGFEVLKMAWHTPEAGAQKFYNVSEYPFNADATWLLEVTTRFSWIVESGVNGPLVATGLVDKYTTSADYQYLLETNDQYEILGGEWLSGSNANHPDFLWLPANKPDNSTTTDIGLVYAEIEELLTASTSGEC